MFTADWKTVVKPHRLTTEDAKVITAAPTRITPIVAVDPIAVAPVAAAPVAEAIRAVPPAELAIKAPTPHVASAIAAIPATIPIGFKRSYVVELSRENPAKRILVRKRPSNVSAFTTSAVLLAMYSSCGRVVGPSMIVMNSATRGARF